MSEQQFPDFEISITPLTSAEIASVIITAVAISASLVGGVLYLCHVVAGWPL